MVLRALNLLLKSPLTDKAPRNTWQAIGPHEYGFYANVNPLVDHPRWSQRNEKIIAEGSVFQQQRKPTLMFNGYEEEVAHLYKGLDLLKNF